MFLIHTAEGSSVHGNVIRGIRAEEVHLRHFRMVTYLEKWSSLELRRFRPFLQARKLSAQDIHRHLVNVYGNDVMSRQQVGRWGRKFVSDVANISEGNRSGRQSFWTREVNSARVEEPLQTNYSVTFSAYVILLLVCCMALCSRSWCECYSTAAPVPGGCFVRLQTIQPQNWWSI
jgi:hypothetical protein